MKCYQHSLAFKKITYVKNTIIFFLSISFCLRANCQRVIRGKVLDKTNHQPIEYALISTAKNNKTVSTDQQGNFQISIPADSNHLYISIVGYSPKTVELNQNGQPLVIALDRAMMDGAATNRMALA